MEQLQMTWPRHREVPEVVVPEGFAVRPFVWGDEQQYLEILNCGELGSWDRSRLEAGHLCNPYSPRGLFFIQHGDMLVATACGLRHAGAGPGRYRGELGWVAVRPAFRGRGLGYVVSARALQFLVDRDVEVIFLLTDDWRLGAVKTYLRLGFEPVIESQGMEERWAGLYHTLGVQPGDVPRG